MVEWKTTTLDHIGRIVTGKTPATSDPSNYGTAIPFVTPTDMDGRRVINRTIRYLSEHGASQVRSSFLSKPAVLVSCIGSDMGKAVITDRPSVTNQQINSIIVSDEIEFLFVYYNLVARRDELRNLAGGAAQPILNKTDFGHLPITLPPRSVQYAIASILGALDDKIDLNRRMNETLEAMARAIFKDWFMDFGPTRAKMEDRASYLSPEIWALFPDRLDEEGNPEGWRFGLIADLAEVSSGKRPSNRYSEPSALANIPLWGGNGPMGFVTDALVTGPILLTGRVGTLGSVFRITSPCWPSDNTLILKAKISQSYEYLFLQLKHVDFSSLNRGSTQPLLTQTDLKNQEVVLPTKAMLACFHDVAAALYSRINASNSESLSLESIRDLLLPKLMSGEIRVKDAEKIVEAAL